MSHAPKRGKAHPTVTISGIMDTTKELVCVYFILISRIVKHSYKTYAYILVREKREMEADHMDEQVRTNRNNIDNA
jgi:hypothetical protein